MPLFNSDGGELIGRVLFMFADLWLFVIASFVFPLVVTADHLLERNVL